MKQLTIAGILVIIFALGIMYESFNQFGSTISNNTIQALALSPYEVIDVPFQVSNSTILTTVFIARNASVSYYLMNRSAYSNISSLTGNDLLMGAEALKGNGVYEILYNVSSGSYPLQNFSDAGKLDYAYNGTDDFGAGTYYSMYQNLQNSTVTLYYTTITKLQLSETNSIFYSAAFGLTGTVLFIIGVILIGYSVFLKKDQQPREAEDRAELNKLYQSARRKGRKRRRITSRSA